MMRQAVLLLPSLLIMFIPSTFKRPVSSWKALNLRKTLLMASSVRLKPLNCSRLPCVYAQETEFDNGDMYVDGHKAASDVRDEFVSVTEKLMDELAQCYNVLPQLDINNTIDHRPEGDEKWFLENEKTVTQFCRKLAAERPLKDIRDEYNY